MLTKKSMQSLICIKGKDMIKEIYAKTHAEFLNTVFNKNLKGYGSCVWKYPKHEDLIIWMISLTGKRHIDWENKLVQNNTTDHIEETYLGTNKNPLWRRKPINLENLVGKTRLIVSVEECFGKRKYRVLGLYKLSPDSTDFHRIYDKLTNNIAFNLLPELLNKEDNKK